MRLTMYTDYGLRALTRMAAEPDRTFTTDEIASEFGISRNHLVKVIRDLAGSGILSAQHGAARGFHLARDPETITIGEIVRLLESRKSSIDCFRPSGHVCHPADQCLLTTRLSAAREAFLRELDTTMLIDCAFAPQTDEEDGELHRAATKHDGATDYW
jgi:Rrf2 family nitric oxide-sensitive transcriptional repressor